MYELLAAHRHTTQNRAEIEASQTCGCIACMQVFPVDEIVGWSGLDVSSFDNPDGAQGGTALCPRCGGESVIGDRSGYRIDLEFLRRMNASWGRTTIVPKRSTKR